MPTRPFRGHPPGLYVCFATELWERFSYYGMRSLLILYLMQHFLFSDEQSFLIYGAYTAMVYLTPVVGGVIADRFLGARKAVTLGALLLVAGHLGMTIEGPTVVRHLTGETTEIVRDRVALQTFYLSLALITAGVGFLKTNASTLVGTLYAPEDPRRDSAFTIYYLGINLGGAAAPLVCGWVGQLFGWRYGFGLAGLGMLLGLCIFLRYQQYLHGQADPPSPTWLAGYVAGLSRERWIYAASLVLVAAIWWVLERPVLVGPLLSVCAALTAAVILYLAFARCTPVERDRLLACAALIVCTIGFWALYEQMGSSLNVFADRALDRSLGGHEIPAAPLQSLAPIFILLLAPLASMLWQWLGERGRDPPTPVKFALAIALVGLAFLALGFGIWRTPPAGKVPLGWFVLTFFLLTSGELCLAPVGMAMVTRLAPRRLVGLMMGAFFLAYSASSFLAGLLAQLTSAKVVPGQKAEHAFMLKTYALVYSRLGLLALAAAALVAALSPMLRRYMHESRAVPSGSTLEVL